MSSHAPPAPPAPATTDLLSLWIYLFWALPLIGAAQHVALGVWPLSPGMVFSRLTRMAACVSALFLLRLSDVPLCEGTTFCLSIFPSMATWVVSTSLAAVNTRVQVSAWM